MKNFSIKSALRHGWILFKGHKKVLILSTLIWIALSSFDVDADRWPDNLNIILFVLSLALFMLGTLAEIGWVKIMLRLEDGEKTTLHGLFSHTGIFRKYFFAYVLYLFIVVVGFILLIVPGFYLLIRYGFAPLLIIDKKNISLGEAFKESAKLTEGIKWKLLGFFWVFILVNLVGALALGVGLLVSMPVTTLAFIHVYRTLSRAA